MLIQRWLSVPTRFVCGFWMQSICRKIFFRCQPLQLSACVLRFKPSTIHSILNAERLCFDLLSMDGFGASPLSTVTQLFFFGFYIMHFANVIIHCILYEFQCGRISFDIRPQCGLVRWELFTKSCTLQITIFNIPSCYFTSFILFIAYIEHCTFNAFQFRSFLLY